MRNKILSGLFCLLLAGTALLGLLLPDRMFSVREKRKLHQAPELSTETLLDGSFGADLERYLADQFPGRDGWIALRTLSDLAMGKRETGGVYVAEDGYLIDIFSDYDPVQLERNLRAVQTLCKTAEIPVSLMLVPTAQEILADKLPRYAPAVNQKQIEELARFMEIPVVPTADALLAHREEPIYYRTDPHYTSLGAWHCYQAWRAFRGLEPSDPNGWTKEVLSEDFLGTSWSKTGLPGVRPDTITGWYIHPHRTVCYNGTETADEIFARDYLDSPEPYGVFLNSNQALTVIEGSAPAGRLLLIKDSFGNTFAQFPVEDYAQVHMIDLRFFREDLLTYLREQEITEVLVLYGTRNFVSDRNWID